MVCELQLPHHNHSAVTNKLSTLVPVHMTMQWVLVDLHNRVALVEGSSSALVGDAFVPGEPGVCVCVCVGHQHSYATMVMGSIATTCILPHVNTLDTHSRKLGDIPVIKINDKAFNEHMSLCKYL